MKTTMSGLSSGCLSATLARRYNVMSQLERSARYSGCRLCVRVCMVSDRCSTTDGFGLLKMDAISATFNRSMRRRPRKSQRRVRGPPTLTLSLSDQIASGGGE